MSAKFYTLMTDIGAAKLASAAALGIPLKITQMAVGDGGGALPTPDAKQTALVAEKRRAALNMLYIDPQNSSQIIAEQVIPETEGGWWIREVGLFDETGALIAVGNCPESYKPQLVEGSGRTQTVRMVLITSSTDNITLKIDPSVVLATRSYVDNLIETRQQKSDTLTALAELKPAKGKFPYFTAEKAAALADLSDFIRQMLGKEDTAGVLEYLGLIDSAGYCGRLINIRTIKTSGTYTPTAGTKVCYAELQAGGGGGGSAGTCATGQSAGGGGGSAGAYALIKFAPATMPVVIGSGSNGAPANAVGASASDAGNTSIAGVTVYGGSGGWGGPPRASFPQGNNSSGRPGAASNTGTATIIKEISGQPGQGGIAYGATNSYGGGGGNSALGTGAGGGITTAGNGIGASGAGYGSGGSGSAVVSGASSVAGGNGAPGVVIIWEYA